MEAIILNFFTRERVFNSPVPTIHPYYSGDRHVAQALIDRFTYVEDYREQLKTALTASHVEPYSCFYEQINKHTSPFPFPQALDPAVRIIGLQCDPLAWMDQKYKTTLNFLRQHRFLTVHTYSDLCAHDTYLDIIVKNKHRIIIYTHHERWENLQPGHPSIRRRLRAYEKLKAAGANVELIRLTPSQIKKHYRVK